MDPIQTIALTLGSAWASGINLYATVLVLGYLGSSGDVTLPPQLQILTHPLVIGAAGLMYLIEFFADKIPGVDTGWDLLHTFIRIPAGALLAAAAAQGLEVSQGAELAAMLVGGGIAATSHATKTGTRMLINSSPEPVSNWTASIGEDLTVIGGLWASLHYPWAFVTALVLFLLLAAWLLPKLWRLLKRGFGAVGRYVRRRRLERDGRLPAAPARDDILRALYRDEE
ncbi:MAG TPA: DUF4126 domain-containing protein [Sedimenticola thiotaurini]|uniref:DUF4126 domain-containing protein n=1 Tax=Sedimenticola thiotaurini TaxID=1543721 RepID=A0A831RJU6_9GAMM|nr:DUF4126 domain-containing protein [Sedimenticola thiotaurini]